MPSRAAAVAPVSHAASGLVLALEGQRAERAEAAGQAVAVINLLVVAGREGQMRLGESGIAGGQGVHRQVIVGLGALVVVAGRAGAPEHLLVQEPGPRRVAIDVEEIAVVRQGVPEDDRVVERCALTASASSKSARAGLCRA